MKKLIAWMLCLVALLTLCACDTPDNGGNTGDGFVFKTGEITIAIDDDLAPIVKALGKPIYTDEAPSCAHEGTSKFYTYAGIDLESYPKDGKDLVYMVVLIDDTVSTAEGIRVGDSREAVIKAYGDPAETKSDALVYSKGGMYLQFILSEDGSNNVSQIQYMHKEALNAQ